MQLHKNSVHWVLFVLALATVPSQAGPIAIVNPGFESPGLTPGDRTGGMGLDVPVPSGGPSVDVPGWTVISYID